MLLPFWTPLIPPKGMACLKSFLRKYDYNVKIVDANVEMKFKEIYEEYFETLRKYVPGKKRGNIYNIGDDVLINHMMAHFNYKTEKEYIELVKILASRFFYHDINDSQVLQLKKIISEFYSRLEKYFLSLLEKENPAVLGLSVYRSTIAASLFAFKLTKEKYPSIKTVMGGGIFTGELSVGSENFEFFLEKTPYIDKIIIGEGEILFLKYLQGQLDESQRVYTSKDTDRETLELNTVDIPDFSGLEIQYYPNLAGYASRSCPFQCTFCSETVLWGKYCRKKAKQVVEELSKLTRKHNYQLFLFVDSLLNPVIEDLANELEKSDESIYWDGYLRVDNSVCDIKNTSLWRRSGFYRARLGLESGSQRILDWMNKKITTDQIREAVSSLAYSGIKTTTYWLIGYPGETEEDFQQTLDLIEELKDEIYEADCNPFNYYSSGQVNSKKWAEKKTNILLYPEKTKEMLIFQTSILKGEPSREETFKRINRFVEHCNKLGIPNPYSLQEIYKADERWKKMHKNAVPSMMDFFQAKHNKSIYINENKKLNKIVYGESLYDDVDWGF